MGNAGQRSTALAGIHSHKNASNVEAVQTLKERGQSHIIRRHCRERGLRHDARSEQLQLSTKEKVQQLAKHLDTPPSNVRSLLR